LRFPSIYFKKQSKIPEAQWIGRHFQPQKQLAEPVHRKHALKTLGRWFTHPHFKLHACQHLKSRKVKKHVKWDPTKGPLGAKSAKKEPKIAWRVKKE
jgi:hypothetical protein